MRSLLLATVALFASGVARAQSASPSLTSGLSNSIVIAAPFPGKPSATATDTALTSTTTPQTVLPAVTSRLGWNLVNSSVTGGSSGYAYCTDDGSTPTTTHATVIVYSGPGSQQNWPGLPVSPSAIQCVGGGAADVKITAEGW